MELCIVDLCKSALLEGPTAVAVAAFDFAYYILRRAKHTKSYAGPNLHVGHWTRGTEKKAWGINLEILTGTVAAIASAPFENAI